MGKLQSRRRMTLTGTRCKSSLKPANRSNSSSSLELFKKNSGGVLSSNYAKIADVIEGQLKSL